MNATHGFPSPRFDRWRSQARGFLLSGIKPEDANWDSDPLPTVVRRIPGRPGPKPAPVKVTRKFLDFARRVSCHTATDAGALLYSALWRMTHDEPNLFEMLHIPLVRKLNDYHKAVHREIRKAHIFIRFKRMETGQGDERYLAWFEPHFPIVELAAGTLVERFPNMKWSVLTPWSCAHWDDRKLSFSPGVHRGALAP